MRRTGGNPFYVTEVLEAGDERVPATVRDAVLSRVARLEPDARDVLDVVACSPQAAEEWLIDAAGEGLVAWAAESVAAGMLVEAGAGYAFRHEIAREAVAEAIPADRREELHRLMLAALTAAPAAVDPARLAHHAEQAGDAVAAVRFAWAAAERAAAVGAHRQAAAQYGRALRFSEDAPAAKRAELLERRADALYAADDQPASIADLHAAIDLHRELGDPFREAGATARLVPRLTCCALFDEAGEAAERAVELVGSSTRPEAAAAVAALAHVDLVLDRLTLAAERGRDAVAAAERLGNTDAAIEAEIVVGTATFWRDGPAAAALLEGVLERVREPQLESHLPHVLNNLALCAVSWRDHEAAERYAGEGLAYTDGHDLDLWRLSILGTHVRSLLDQGRWTEALEAAAAILSDRRASPGPRGEALAVLATVRARRGDPAPPGALAEAAATYAGQPVWEAQIASTHAEVAWLDGRVCDIDALTAGALVLSAEGESPWPVRRARAVAASRRPRRSRVAAPCPSRSPSSSRAAMPTRRRPGTTFVAPTRRRWRCAWPTTRPPSRRPTAGCGTWVRQRRPRSRPGAFVSAASAASRAGRGARRAATRPSSRPARSPCSTSSRTASRTPRSPSGCSCLRAPSTTTSRRSCGSSTHARGARLSPPAAGWASSNPGSAPP